MGPSPGLGMPGLRFHQPGQIRVGVPDGRQRKLAVQPFDGKELYHGFGSGFLESGKGFGKSASPSVRAVLFGPKTSRMMCLVNTLPEQHTSTTVGRWSLGGLRVKPLSMRCKGCSRPSLPR